MANQTKMTHYEAAIEHYSRAIDLRPGFAISYIYRANVYRKMGEFDLAIKDYTEAIRWALHPAEAYHGRGMAQGAKGELDKAIEDFTQAIDTNPTMLRHITIVPMLMLSRERSIVIQAKHRLAYLQVKERTPCPQKNIPIFSSCPTNTHQSSGVPTDTPCPIFEL